MLDFKQKNRVRRALYAKPTIIALVIVFLFVANGAWGMYQKSTTSITNKNSAEGELSSLKSREIELSQDIVNLSTDRGIEEEIRERFMVAKEGESVMVIANPKEEKIHTVTVPDTEETMVQKMLGASGLSGE
jgi:cell division protein FtsB